MGCACSARKNSAKNSLRKVTKKTPVSRTRAVKTIIKRVKRPLY